MNRRLMKLQMKKTLARNQIQAPEKMNYKLCNDFKTSSNSIRNDVQYDAPHEALNIIYLLHEASQSLVNTVLFVISKKIFVILSRSDVCGTCCGFVARFRSLYQIILLCEVR